jgi:hypothetical protein
MLYISLIESAVILGLASLLSWKSRSLLEWLVAAAIVVLLTACVGMTLFAPMLQVLLLIPIAIYAGVRGRSYRWFLVSSLVATVLAYGVTSIYAWRRVIELREEWPYESLAERAPEPEHNAQELTPAQEKRLSRFETEMDDLDENWRSRLLRDIHENQVRVFVNSFGFGVGRMGRLPLTPDVFEFFPPAEKQPGERSSERPSTAFLNDSVREGLANANLNNASFFADPRQYGYVKDREHVAGFRKHAFRRQPLNSTEYRVASVDLLGLLLREEPVVYVSELLPSMDKVHETPTRELDRFEQDGLGALRHGEDLFIGEIENGLRMLGALRAAKQCVGCHGGKRGDLLGAFSYTLRPAEKKE